MLDDTMAGGAVMEAGGDVGAVETPQVTETPEIQTETPETPQITEGQEPQQEQVFDQKGVPSLKAVKEALGQIGNKQVADYFRKEHFSLEGYRKAFADPQSAIVAKETLETLGGDEGITALRQENQDFARELQMFAEGNPELLDDLIADDKDGFLKLAPAAFDKLRSVNPELYNGEIIRGFDSILKSSGFPDGMNTMASGVMELVSHIQEGRQQAAYDTARNLASWMQRFQKLGTAERPQFNAPDERAKRLDERESELKRTEENNYRQDLNAQVNDTLKPMLQRALAPLMKGRTLTTEQKQRLESAIYTDIAKDLQADKKFQEKRRMLGERRDSKGVINLFRGRLEELVPKIVKSVWSGSGFSSGAVRQAAPSNGNNVVSMGGKPRAEDIDWSKDRNRNRFMSGEATLKNGKTVRWNWNNV